MAELDPEGWLQEPQTHDAYLCGWVLPWTGKDLRLLLRRPGAGALWQVNGPRLTVRLEAVKLLAASDVWNVGIVARVNIQARRFHDFASLAGDMEGLVATEELVLAGAEALDFASGISKLALIPSYGAAMVALGYWDRSQVMFRDGWHV